MNGEALPNWIPMGNYFVGDNEREGFIVTIASSFQVNGSGDFHLATGGSIEI